MVEASQGITRRQALKRGLVIGTGVVWATPVVQAIGISEAYAQQASAPPTNGGGNGGSVGGGGGGSGGNGGGDSGGNGGNGGNGDNGDNGPIDGGSGDGGPPTVIGGKVVTPGPGGAAQGPTTEVTAETLPLTGIDVLPIAAAGTGLMAAGAASLQIAKQMEGSEGPAEEIPAGPDDD